MAFQPTPLWNPTSTAPPWDWNPAASYITAYNTMQKTAQDRERFVIEQELERELLPIKKQLGQLSLEKALLDLDKTRAEIDRQREFTRQARSLYGNTDMGNRGESTSGSKNYFNTTANQQPSSNQGPAVLVDFTR